MVHFGLGSATDVIQMGVEWPSDRYQVMNDVMVDRLMSVVEPSVPTG